MSGTKKYWQSLEQLKDDTAFIEKAHNEFAEPIPVDEFLGKAELNESATSRRDFLKFLGFSVAAASLAACETPVTKSIPYVVKPEEVTPGVANWYASTFADGMDYCSILVKTREGRPIHIEGNKMSKVTSGGVNARVNSSVLSLYDSYRLKQPLANGNPATWMEVDDAIGKKLGEISNRGGNIRLVTNSIMSPSTKMAIAGFEAALGAAGSSAMSDTGEGQPEAASFRHITYDAVSHAGMINANEASFGKAVIPDYRFEKAKTIVSISADFLGDWLSSIEYARQYVQNRKPGGKWMSRHYQFETNMSLTGSNADVRGAIKPSEQGNVAVKLYNQLAKNAGAAPLKSGELADDNNLAHKIEHAAKDLLASKGQSLVVAGSNDVHVQTVVNAINDLLGNYGSTIDLGTPLNLRQGNDTGMDELVKEMNAGKVDALLVYGTNPAYTSPSGWGFAEAMGKVKLKVSFAGTLDETASLCDYVCPDNHYLESWNDANPKGNHYSICQPVINRLFDTRQAQDSLLKWSGSKSYYHQYIRKNWEENIFPRQTKTSEFTAFWNKSVHDGVCKVSKVQQPEAAGDEANKFNGDLASAAAAIAASAGGSAWELSLYTKTGIGEGQQAGNPWLHELPDPVTKVVWDNYITMNPADMEGYNTQLGQESYADMARVTANGQTIELPVCPQPGQKRGTIGIALGYGRTKVGKAGLDLGKNAYPLTGFEHGTLKYNQSDVTIEKIEGTYPLTSTQTHHTMMGRKIINETDITTFKNKPAKEWNDPKNIKDAYGNEKERVTDNNLWKDHPIKQGHRWGLSIDLNSCIGCGACVTACTSENNVPVVGREEIRLNREMHWLRIDRYYSSDANKEDNTYKDMEIPSEYPEVAYQPVMCQHCNHAPCETVCPVAATTHSNEGLNMMAYNRCVGTRYCANNCPFKVRRFNWFNYIGYKKFTDINPAQDDLARMVLNPDVVVRSRGVMEKCSLCIQRIQAGKLQAKKEGRKVKDGEIQTACSAACTAGAITFGDHNDSSTRIHKDSNDNRAYHLLEELGVQPNIWYLTKVRNKKENNA